MNVVVIPARGGSKRIPRKNIKEFCGRPIIAYSIEAARQAAHVDRVLVSTDDDEIAEIALEFGAEVPFYRPGDLSDDHAATLAVMSHAVSWMEDNWGLVDKVCCLYPTAPFITSDILDQALSYFAEDADLNFVFSGTSFAFPIFRGLRVRDNQRVEMIWPEMESRRSQDFEEAYHDAGQFYWGTHNSWLSCSSIFSANSRIFYVSRHAVQDIDTMEDWQQAEAMYQVIRRNISG
jgi:N-acylneuraminate cytidylyltransferase